MLDFINLISFDIANIINLFNKHYFGNIDLGMKMNNFKQKKLNSIIHTLIFKLSLGTLALLPVSVNADTFIDDNNIGNYKKTGIKISDDLVIDINGTAPLPHIDIDQNSRVDEGLSAASNRITTINGDLFRINSQKSGKSSAGYNAFSGIKVWNNGHFTSNSKMIDMNIKSGYGFELTNGADAVIHGQVNIKGGAYSAGIFTYNSSRTNNSFNAKRTKGTFNDKVVINIEGEGGKGIISRKAQSPNVEGNDLTFNDTVKINIITNAGTGTGIDFQQFTPFTEDSDGQDRGDVMTFNKGLNLNIKGGTAISMAQHKGKLVINDGSNGIDIIVHDPEGSNKAIDAAAGQVTINGQSKIIGDIFSSENDVLRDKGIVNLNLTDGSMLLSSLNNDNGAGEINLDLSGSNSQWKMTGSSNINTLKLADDAKVRFGYDYATPDTATGLNQTNAMTLTADSLEGNGIFEMRTAIGKFENHDVLKITGSGQATGDHKIMVNDAQTGDARVDGSETFRLVETEGGDANFTLATPYVDVGAFKYNKLSQVTDRGNGSKDWVLSTSSNSPTPELSDTAQDAANILNTNYLMNYVETQTLLQRMGQIRTDDTASGKVWGRIYTGKLSSFNDNRLSGFDMDYYGLQLGLDRKLNYDKVNLYYGVMGGLSRGEVDHNVGDGSTKNYSLGLYGTLQSQNGFYLDGLVKYMHMTNKFNTLTGGGSRVTGDGHTNGFSMGAEIGKRIHLTTAENNEQGWYLEPQAQLTYSHQDGATIEATNGLSTRLDSYNSLIGRASIILGYTIQSDKNPIDIYFKTGYQKEFDGETSYTFNRTVKEKYKFDGNWWDNGIGVNMRLNRNHHIYGDMVYSVGNKFDQKQVNAGYRYNF